MYPEISQELKSRVMRRVYGIWFLRSVLPWVLMEMALLALFFWQMTDYVWVRFVWENFIIYAKAHPLGFLGFPVNAIMWADMASQLTLLGLAVAGALFAKDIAKSMRSLGILAK